MKMLPVSGILAPEELEVLAELVHIGMDKACSSINAMASKHVRWEVPILSTVISAKASDEENEIVHATRLEFTGLIAGSVYLIFNDDSAVIFTSIINKIDVKLCDEETVTETLKEVANITVNSIVGTLSTQMTSRVTFGIPIHEAVAARQTVASAADRSEILAARTTFSIDDTDIVGSFSILFTVRSIQEIKTLLKRLLESAPKVRKPGSA